MEGNCDWVNTMRPMNHTSCNSLLLLKISDFLMRFCDFGHILKILEAAEGIGVGVRLKGIQRIFVLGTVPMDRTRFNHHLLGMIMLLTFKELLTNHYFIGFHLVEHILIIVVVIWLRRKGAHGTRSHSRKVPGSII